MSKLLELSKPLVEPTIVHRKDIKKMRRDGEDKTGQRSRI